MSSEKRQLIKLRLALSKALQSAMSAVTKETLNASFPTLTRDCPSALDATRDQIVDYLQSNCQEEFETILLARGIPLKLSQLENLKPASDAKA